MDIRKIVTTITVVLTLAILAQGCNTIRGAGQDLEKAGEAVQDAAE